MNEQGARNIVKGLLSIINGDALIQIINVLQKQNNDTYSECKIKRFTPVVKYNANPMPQPSEFFCDMVAVLDGDWVKWEDIEESYMKNISQPIILEQISPSDKAVEVYCPACKNPLSGCLNYCSNCGQKLCLRR